MAPLTRSATRGQSVEGVVKRNQTAAAAKRSRKAQPRSKAIPFGDNNASEMETNSPTPAQRKRKLAQAEQEQTPGRPTEKMPRYVAALEKARFAKNMRIPSHKFLVPPRLYAVLNGPKPTPEVVVNHGWNANKLSDNVMLIDPNTMLRGTRAQVTDCVIGKVGFKSGFHVWAIIWPEDMRGTNPVVGVAEKTIVPQMSGYVSMLGLLADSYGWDLRKNEVLHETFSHKVPAVSRRAYPTLFGSKPFEAPKKIYCILDMDEGYLAFATDHSYLGVAFRGLQGKTLYPAVSSVWGNSTIAIHYIGGLPAEAPSLFSQCMRTLRGMRDANQVPKLIPNLPPYIQGMLYFQQ
ncbi:hypothetical protein WR25_21885 [Diploscapter pachys]|uniref:B30.2/SPRY domain-containing protein n=1 Tax=Diploscapter pachys TaxID=2018661 RepID=A0A2A2LKA9_9BILA|nr:hypothetical protein WR25_21885 [Diploscapter pachys]